MLSAMQANLVGTDWWTFPGKNEIMALIENPRLRAVINDSAVCKMYRKNKISNDKSNVDDDIPNLNFQQTEENLNTLADAELSRNLNILFFMPGEIILDDYSACVFKLNEKSTYTVMLLMII